MPPLDPTSDLARRVRELERLGVRFRQGEITDDSPLSVAVGGETTAYTGVTQLETAGPLQTGDIVAVLVWAGDLLIVGRMSSPDAWHDVGTGSEPAFTNSWVNHASLASARFTRDADGTVHVEGCIKNGTNGASAFTLPIGYRPGRDLIFAAHQYDGASVVGNSTVRVGSDGTVKFSGTGTLAECWINATFRAA